MSVLPEGYYYAMAPTGGEIAHIGHRPACPNWRPVCGKRSLAWAKLDSLPASFRVCKRCQAGLERKGRHGAR